MGHALDLPATDEAHDCVVRSLYAMADDGDLDLHDLDAVRNAAEDVARLLSRTSWEAIARFAIGEIMFEEAA